MYIIQVQRYVDVLKLAGLFVIKADGNKDMIMQ